MEKMGWKKRVMFHQLQHDGHLFTKLLGRYLHPLDVNVATIPLSCCEIPSKQLMEKRAFGG